MCQKALVNACGHVSVFSWRLTFLWLVGCILRLFILFPFRYVSLCLSVCLSVCLFLTISLPVCFVFQFLLKEAEIQKSLYLLSVSYYVCFCLLHLSPCVLLSLSAGVLKMMDLKTQDMKMTDQVARREIARPEIMKLQDAKMHFACSAVVSVIFTCCILTLVPNIMMVCHF